ncbi:uncharacterized protein BDZ99DRAFT_570282 [Mytilinidion resinicola]|uniref:F-box domain-containing protein n=1 Tax=Mytilinidion resinicola TaxID=574789 RepID=A0A6A6YSW2_9PEZI|nr:uncharacterized protein BDZ99DRAFT_570282 [Mytilinidion resinicola]KAF2811007.1 hypothetical protein BDZ99DRAFT_570282 [Mytilinidion resinicola]
MASPLAKLPNELSLDIFDMLLSFRRDLVSCLRCCRRWHNIVVDILYNHVYLTHRLRVTSPLRLFVIQATRVQQVESLTLSVCPTLFSKEPKSPFKGDKLIEFLPHMTTLRNFSLTISLSKFSKNLYYVHTPSAILSEIILALPETVVNIELRSGIWDGNRDYRDASEHRTDEHDLCVALRVLLPRLHTLRLCVSHICAKFLAATGNAVNISYPLRQVTIHPEDNTWSETWDDDIIRQMASFYNLKTFPHLQSFNILTHNPRWGTKITWSTWAIRDIVSNTTSLIPYKWPVRSDELEMWVLRDTAGKDHMFRNRYWADDAIEEGLSTWVLGYNHMRLPRGEGTDGERRKLGLKDVIEKTSSVEFGKHIIQLPQNGSLYRQTAVDKYGAQMDLWKWESMTESTLMRACCQKGFLLGSDLVALEVTLPPNWEWSREIDEESDDSDDPSNALMPVYKGI